MCLLLLFDVIVLEAAKRLLKPDARVAGLCVRAAPNIKVTLATDAAHIHPFD